MSRLLSTLNFSIPTLNELIFATGCKPDAFEPTLCYIASINNHQEKKGKKDNYVVNEVVFMRDYCEKLYRGTKCELQKCSNVPTQVAINKYRR